MSEYEIAIAIVQFGTLVVLIFMLLLTRGDYVSRMRPYIGFDDVRIKDSPREDEIALEVYVRNVGNIPAKNATLYGKFVIGGEETAFKCETKGSVFPSSPTLPTWRAGITEIDKAAILEGRKSLRLSLIVDYYGVGKKQYRTSSSRTYDSTRQDWTNEEGEWE